MPTEDMSRFIGSSPSPAVDRVIENNTNVQQGYMSTDAALADKHTLHPVTDLSKTQK